MARRHTHPTERDFSSRRRLHERNRSLAQRTRAPFVDRAERSDNAGRIGEAAVEHRQAVDASAVDFDEMRDRIDARQIEGLERRVHAGRAGEREQAVGRGAIDGRRRAMNALG